MPQEILINITSREVRVALLENRILQEVSIERYHRKAILGNIYKGKVTRLLPGLQAAFVDIGLDKAAFLHQSDMPHHESLYVGQELLVQIYKDSIGTKGARLTTDFTIPARYLVLKPGRAEIQVSQKIENVEERARLQKIIQPSPHGGYIFRTVAQGVAAAELENDQNYLNTVWSEILARSETARHGELVYEELPQVLRVLRDLVREDIDKIRVDNLEAFTKMQTFANRYMPKLESHIEYYQSERPLFDMHGVEGEIQKALERKVELKSGGHIVIDQTEAMITIDVNTGANLGKHYSEETILRTNKEAASAIARQLRLRNLGGIIIIDFIDMRIESHKKDLLAYLVAELAKDTVKIHVSELSSLGLIQLTRKRTKESLEHILCITCPSCQKRGSIKSLETISYEIIRELSRIAQHFAWAGFEIVASAGVVNTLMSAESSLLAETEKQLGKKIRLRIEPSYSQEKYEVLPLPEKD